MNIDSKLYKKGDENCYTLCFSQNPSKLLLNILYEDATVYLNRKYELAKFFKNNCRSFKELKELLGSNIEETPEMDNIEINSEITKGSESS